MAPAGAEEDRRESEGLDSNAVQITRIRGQAKGGRVRVLEPAALVFRLLVPRAR